jgi:hypothetical protein
LITPFANKEAMIQHMKQVSEATEEDRHAVVSMGGAGYGSDICHIEYSKVMKRLLM